MTDPDVLAFCDSLALARAHKRIRGVLENPKLSERDKARLRELLSKESLTDYEESREAWAEAARLLPGPTFK